MLRLFGVVLAMALLLVAVSGAEAKMPSYVLAGGELGPYAAFVTAPIPSDDEPWPGWLPSEDDRAIAQPVKLPSLMYDLYGSYGSAGIPYQMVNGGPDFRYYPERHLLHERRSDGWYELGPAAVTFLDGAIADALAKVGRGELEVGPVAADLVGRHLPEVTYWLRSTSNATLDFVPPLSSCGECVVLRVSGEEFIMRDVLETLSGAPERAQAELPAYVIEFYGTVEPPYGGIGGVLGYYTPPSGERTGRFWADGFGSDTLFFETTPGFDATIAGTLSRAEGSSEAADAELAVSTASDGSTATIVGAGVALVVAVFAAGAVRSVARRRG